MDVPGFCDPFYLAHPRLMKLEEVMREVEGGTDVECYMRILRHELVNALENGLVRHSNADGFARWIFAQKSPPLTNLNRIAGVSFD